MLNRTLAGHLDASFDLQTSEFRFADVRVSICRRPSFDLQTSEFRFADVRLRYTNSEFADASPCKSGIGGHRWGDRRIAPKVSPGGHFGGVLPSRIEPEQDMEIDAEVSNKVRHLKFPGRGQRETPVGDIYAVVELIMVLPGRRAGLVRSEAARLFVKCYGGDPALAVPGPVGNLGGSHFSHRVAGEVSSSPRRLLGPSHPGYGKRRAEAPISAAYLMSNLYG